MASELRGRYWDQTGDLFGVNPEDRDGDEHEEHADRGEHRRRDL
jgi:hypothetical protein